MLAIAVPKNKEPATTRAARRSKSDTVSGRLGTFASPAGAALANRTPGCACGGGCPRCSGEAHHPNLHTKLKVSTSRDQYEREADRMAEHVMQIVVPLHDHQNTGFSKSPGGVVQRKCASCADDEDFIQKKEAPKPSASENSGKASPMIRETLRSSGTPLDSATRLFMEERFGHDFSRVRVHDDASADVSAQSVDALAYTVGDNIVFAAGQYAAGTSEGRRLLAHELTHVVQQSLYGSGVQAELAVGGAHDQAEIEAARMAHWAVAEQPSGPPPVIASQPPLLRRQQALQRRGAPAQHVRLEQPPRGEDQVSIIIFRYLCDCRGRDVTQSRVLHPSRPTVGVLYEFCRGRTTLRLNGDVTPNSLTTGSATAGIDLNVSPVQGGAGARVHVEGEVRNTGTEPEVGGRGTATVAVPGAPDLSIRGSVFRGTQTGQLDTSVGAGVQSDDLNLSIDVTNPQDSGRAGVIFGVGVPLPGERVERRLCRECSCPAVYDCFEDVAPRAVRDDPYEVFDTSRLRYYYRLDTTEDATSPALRTESTQMFDRLRALLADGWTIVSITGYASPEAAEREHNEPLSLSRGQHLRQMLATRLGANVSLPEAEAGRELLGSVPTILPGSRLADATFEAGFNGPEQVSQLLVGGEIANDQLAGQFLALFDRIVEPADRLRLFGVSAESPIAAQLLLAIQRFIASRGRGGRPWDRTFEFLRFATVEVRHSRMEASTTFHYTRGSFNPVDEARCNRFAGEAEANGLFAPIEPEPTIDNCPTGEPRNDARYGPRCRYD